MRKKKIVILTGAGMSAESGIETFRGAGGLWAGFDINEVASPEGWHANPKLVLDFYNARRKNALDAMPNLGHLGLAALEKDFDIQIITQNVDNLHEKAGSTHVLHLHGELFKARSTRDENLIYAIDGWELNLGDLCELGSQLRPHIVWFGELVPEIEKAINIVKRADAFVVIGTSLAVYPAASLLDFVHPSLPKFIIDPEIPALYNVTNLIKIQKGAGEGVKKLSLLLHDHLK
jgi:NAD-dependent deacetylase